MLLEQHEKPRQHGRGQPRLVPHFERISEAGRQILEEGGQGIERARAPRRRHLQQQRPELAIEMRHRVQKGDGLRPAIGERLLMRDGLWELGRELETSGVRSRQPAIVLARGMA